MSQQQDPACAPDTHRDCWQPPLGGDCGPHCACGGRKKEEAPDCINPISGPRDGASASTHWLTEPEVFATSPCATISEAHLCSPDQSPRLCACTGFSGSCVRRCANCRFPGKGPGCHDLQTIIAPHCAAAQSRSRSWPLRPPYPQSGSWLAKAMTAWAGIVGMRYLGDG